MENHHIRAVTVDLFDLFTHLEFGALVVLKSAEYPLFKILNQLHIHVTFTVSQNLVSVMPSCDFL
jgi:hypothetical protein